LDAAVPTADVEPAEVTTAAVLATPEVAAEDDEEEEDADAALYVLACSATHGVNGAEGCRGAPFGGCATRSLADCAGGAVVRNRGAAGLGWYNEAVGDATTAALSGGGEAAHTYQPTSRQQPRL